MKGEKLNCILKKKQVLEKRKNIQTTRKRRKVEKRKEMEKRKDIGIGKECRNCTKTMQRKDEGKKSGKE